MKTALKVMSIISIVIGGLATLGCVYEFESAAFIGGLFYIAQGTLALIYIKQTAKQYDYYSFKIGVGVYWEKKTNLPKIATLPQFFEYQALGDQVRMEDGLAR